MEKILFNIDEEQRAKIWDTIEEDPAYIRINVIAELSASCLFDVALTVQVTLVFSFACKLKWVQALDAEKAFFKLLLLLNF